ncbi:hypothetical protein I4U23_021689 [Adineta vaga]|nr:hypothetical protein I4U23_021689 [Adineta vaga]
MLMKFGQVEDAEDFFRQVKTFDSTIYGTIMNGYKINNQPFECLSIFEEVKKKNVEINIPIALALIGACAHLQNNLRLKSSLIDICFFLVNVYARNGMGYEAIDLYKQIPDNIRNTKSHVCVLSACSHSTLIDQTRTIINEINNKTEDVFITMINCLSRVGTFTEVQDLIHIYEKFHSPSVMYVNGEIMKFIAHDRSHPRSKEIYDELSRLSKKLKEHGHEYDSRCEKLAIAFNFIQQPRPSFIQITKNLRVCGDCHRATKMIAKIRQCEIVVRDANRIHHFSSHGQCSCQDHF